MKQKKRILVISILLLFFGGIVYYFYQKQFYQKHLVKKLETLQDLRLATSKLQHGDIIFRRCADAISDMFVTLNQHNKTYSHCGIYLVQNEIGYVYHSIGGEDNPDAVIKKESFTQFVDCKNNLGFGIYQLPFTAYQLQQLDSIVTNWYKLHYTFDMEFSLTNKASKMYCAEFVVKAIEQATKDSIQFTRSKIVAKNFIYVAPDDIQLNKNMQLQFASNK